MAFYVVQPTPNGKKQLLVTGGMKKGKGKPLLTKVPPMLQKEMGKMGEDEIKENAWRSKKASNMYSCKVAPAEKAFRDGVCELNFSVEWEHRTLSEPRDISWPGNIRTTAWMVKRPGPVIVSCYAAVREVLIKGDGKVGQFHIRWEADFFFNGLANANGVPKNRRMTWVWLCYGDKVSMNKPKIN